MGQVRRVGRAEREGRHCGGDTQSQRVARNSRTGLVHPLGDPIGHLVGRSRWIPFALAGEPIAVWARRRPPAAPSPHLATPSTSSATKDQLIGWDFPRWGGWRVIRGRILSTPRTRAYGRHLRASARHLALFTPFAPSVFWTLVTLCRHNDRKPSRSTEKCLVGPRTRG
jgi:hypothetical protein